MVKEYEFPLTGHFISNRESTINWCPIGRNALPEDREKWIELDKKHFVREWFIEDFKNTFSDNNITIKLGGETSFDIYPKGWNKTFPLDKTPFLEYNKIYFAGDRCQPTGNDEELYNHLKNKKDCNGFQVNDPEETINIIKQTIGVI